MSLVLWRLCFEEAAQTAADAFSGDGPAQQAKRWNHAGRRVVYCSLTQAMALLETIVDVPRGARPRLVLYRADVPDDLASERIEPGALPPDWRATPAPATLRDLVEGWLERKRAPMLYVPSAIVPAEPNVLLSPEHPEFARIAVFGPFPFDPDGRLFER